MHLLLTVIIAIFSLPTLLLAANKPIHHDLKVTINPDGYSLTVQDTITLPDDLTRNDIIFALNKSLDITTSDKLKNLGHTGPAQDVGIDREDNRGSNKVQVNRYAIKEIGKKRQITLTYQGKIHYPVKQQNEEYARSFSQSPGLIDPQGVYLAGATYWIPTFDDRMVTYDLSITLP